MDYKKLFEPMKIGKVEIKNRIVMAPMLMGFGQFDGTVTEKMADYYEERAKGGAGLIITEITRVNDVTGASAFGQLSMSHDRNIDSAKMLADRIHKHGAKLFIQLHHPGRQNLGLLIGTVPLSIGMDKAFPFYNKLLYTIVPAGKVLMEKHIVPRVVSPSKCERSYFADSVNKALSAKQIKVLINQFIDAAERVQKSGADGVELHAAHGYLIQQFLSPNTNKRTDEYGGSLENRMRFLLEIIAGIRKRCGKDFPIIVRLTVDECYSFIGKKGKGYDLAEGVKMAKRLEQAGIDAIDVSSAAYDTFNYWLEPTSFKCGWRAYMAAEVKKNVSIPVLAANLIRSPEQAVSQLKDGVQDFVSLGRPTIADPHWVQKVEQGRPEDIKRCICCLYCIESMMNNAYKGSHGKCSVNPFVGREALELKKDGDGRTVVIVGAGPAGLMSAELLGKRGFKPIVIEKGTQSGGQLLLAAAPPDKEKFLWCIEDLETAAKKNGAEFVFNTEATADIIKSYNPYAVIFATGAVPVKPKSIAGSELDNVYTPDQILTGEVALKDKRVAVIGSGMTGLETAELLCKDNSVFVVEMADEIAPGTWMQHKDDVIPKLKEHNVEFYTGRMLTEITADKIKTKGTKKNAPVQLADCDAVVLSLGVRSEKSIYDDIKAEMKNVYVIGDADKTGRIADATNAALDTVLKI